MPRSSPSPSPAPAAETTAPAARSRAVRVLSGFPVVLGFLAGMAVCALGMVALALLRGQPLQEARLPSPQPAADAVCAAVIHQDYTALYGLLASGQQAAGTQAQFVASQRQLDVAAGRATSCAASITLVDGAQASVTFSVTR